MIVVKQLPSQGICLVFIPNSNVKYLQLHFSACFKCFAHCTTQCYFLSSNWKDDKGSDPQTVALTASDSCVKANLKDTFCHIRSKLCRKFPKTEVRPLCCKLTVVSLQPFPTRGFIMQARQEFALMCHVLSLSEAVLDLFGWLLR